MGISIRPSDFNELASSQNMKTTRRILFLVFLSTILRSLSFFFSQWRLGEKLCPYFVKCQCRLRLLGRPYRSIFAVLLLTLYFENKGAVRKLSVGIVRRETFLDMVSIDNAFRRFTSRLLVVCFVGDYVEGEC